MAKQQVILHNVKLGPRPLLNLTDDQVQRLYLWDKQICLTIFDNQADWFQIYDEAQAIQTGYENYLADLFSGKSAEEQP